jgi:hypothetical protein
MAAKIRCPDCRALFRPPEAPESGTEIECPECGVEFTFRDDPADTPPAEDRPKKKGKKAGKKAPDGPQVPRKRKAKRKKSNPYLVAGILIAALIFVGSFAGALIWFFTKKSASQEMMTFLPDDCDEVFGLNVGHLQKYPEFYTSCENSFAGKGFKAAGDRLAAALGGQKFNDIVEYVVQGSGKVGGQPGGAPLEATVLRINAEFDQGALAKLPGAQKATSQGVDYYRIPDPGLNYGPQGVYVFAPTNRLVVFTRGDTPKAKLDAMLTGNKDKPDATAFVRGGQLSKYISRGTVWKFTLYGRSVGKPVSPKASQQAGGGAGGAPGGGGGELSEDDMLKEEIASITAPAQGSGYKASVGSRDVRGEWVVWFKDSSAASDMAKKWKEKDWVQDSEKDVPRWFKGVANKTGIGKTAVNVVRDYLTFKSSGELFVARAQAETNLLKNGVGSLVGAFSDTSGGGPPGMPVQMPGGPGGPPGITIPPGRGPRRAVRRVRLCPGLTPRMPV